MNKMDPVFKWFFIISAVIWLGLVANAIYNRYF